MSLQPVQQHRSAANGFGRRRVEKEMGTRTENKSQFSKTNPSRLTNAEMLSGSKNGGYESPSRERLVYLTACLMGHHVEVQVKDGSLLSGILHATNAEKDFGIILKSARSTKGGSSQGQKAALDSVSKTPLKTIIVPAKELVQIIAKDVSVIVDGSTNDLQATKPHDIMLDSTISQSHRIEMERQLERWVPDEDDSQCPELENIFDGRWNRFRGWDQFEANETLFGVKSTFDEELYTTKLERGPQTRDLEREALRIAREIEGEDTQDLHLAEERGIQLHENFDVDEETRYSSVFRAVDDSGYDENEDILLDSHNSETFGDAPGSVVSTSFADLNCMGTNDGAQVSSSYSSMDEVKSSHGSTGREIFQSGWDSHARDLSSEFRCENFSPLDGEKSVQERSLGALDKGNTYPKEYEGKQMPGEEAKMVKSDDLHSSLKIKKQGFDKQGLSPNATAYAPSSHLPHKGQDKKTSTGDVAEEDAVVKTQVAPRSVNSRGRPGSSASSTSDCGRPASASGAPGLSPSSSVCSLSSEKSSLNPHAKEFKFNPNAKSFVPSHTPVRPASPVSDGAFHFPPNSATAVPHMHGMPVGIGMGPFSGHQPVLFNPQAAPMQSPQAYFHPNGPQYGQQMILGHPQNVMYLPSYPPEMPYRGRDFGGS